jgi:glycosyltransferase involved in cell wall biosynthesis
VRILIVNWRDIDHPWAGGGEVNIHEQAKRWVQWGHQVTMLCGGYPIRHRGAPKDTVVDGVRIIRRGGRFTVYHRAALYYLRHLRGQFDVVIDVANGIPMWTPLYCRLPKIVLFHHIHLKQWFVELPWPLAIFGWFLERFVVRLVYGGVPAVAISESTRQELRQVGFDPAKVAVVRPGLDHARYGVDSVRPEPRRLVYVGRLRHYKRLDTLIRLTKDLSAEFPDIKLDVVGIGEDRPYLEGLVGREGVADRVVFHGYADHDEKVRLLQQGWVFVMPSLNEGWGISVLEANACGLPAVAFDVPGLNESIRDGETGLLGRSYEELRDRVRTLFVDPDQRRRLSEEAARWSAQFDWDATARQLLGVLGAVCPEPTTADLPVTAPH